MGDAFRNLPEPSVDIDIFCDGADFPGGEASARLFVDARDVASEKILLNDV